MNAIPARIRPPTYYNGPSVSLGSLLGNTYSTEVLQEINNRKGSAYYRDIYATRNDAFMVNHVRPIQQNLLELQALSVTLMGEDRIVPLVTEDDLLHIPPCMHLPILLYPPVRDLLNRGRIDGFGYDPEELPEEDVYGRLLNNGAVNSVIDAYIGDTEQVMVRWHMKGSDPEITLNEMDYIRETREFIDQVLETTVKDPTLITQMRG